MDMRVAKWRERRSKLRLFGAGAGRE